MRVVPARISVVVPIYNVAAYLEACLDSLAQQTMADLEIVMVDDGSTDESVEIAERFAERDARFQLVRQANAGLGAARNTGVRHATGEFVAFVDSDDLVPARAYEVLIEALDRTGSDFAAGNVRRLTSAGTRQANFLARPFERKRLKTHISLFPSLLADRTAWNKLFRKSFWDRHGFRFPEGVFHEDIAVMLTAHVLASTVDVVDQTVYLWRMREGDDLSITQRRTEPKVLRDRVSAVDSVSRFLAERGLRSSKSRYDRSVVMQDLRFHLDVLPRAMDEYRRLFLDLANEFLDRADRYALDLPLAIDRLKWQLVRRRALPELLEVLRFEDEELGRVPPVRRGRHWYGDYPYRGDPRLQIPDHVYRLDRELALVARVDELRWEGNALRVEGHAYIEGIGAPEPHSQQVELAVRGAGRRFRTWRLQAEPAYRPDVTAAEPRQVASLDWSGFVATVPVDRITDHGRRQSGRWEIEVVARAGGVTRKTERFESPPLRLPPVAESPAAGDVDLRAALGSNGQLTVGTDRRPLVRSCSLHDGVLQIEGDAGSGRGAPVTLQVSRGGGTAVLEYPVHLDRSGDRPTFLARVPVGDLVGENDALDQMAPVEQLADGVHWDVRLAGAGRRQALGLGEPVSETTWTVGERQIGVRRTRSGALQLVQSMLRPLVTGVEWTSSGALLLTGSFRGEPGDYDLVLSSRNRSQTYGVPLEYDAESARFEAELTPAAVTSLGGPHTLAEGWWDLLLRRRGSGQETGVSAVLDEDIAKRLPLSTQIGHKRVDFGVLGSDTPVLAVERDLDEDERGGFAQRRLRTSFYPAQRGHEVRDVVLYDCFGGRAYSDSPRAIHQELVRRDAPFEHLWVVRDGAFDPPTGAVAVRELSSEYYESFARARYVVANDHWPRWFLRRPEQTCLQTWHGAPLKRHGHDLADRPRAFREYRRVLSQRRENWHYVVSPGSFATPILRSAFPVDEVIETGLPRTDLLLGSGRDGLADEVKQRLGLRGEWVVLYAPTYRDQLAHRGGYRLGPLLDLAALRSALGDDHVVLFRKHGRMVGALPDDAGPFVKDVSEYPDATELLLVADVLVTDYSSLSFDFAATGRPMVFFAPDLDAFREVRGFSVDFEAHAPGPLLRTTDEVVEALQQPDALRADYVKRYESFVATYCPLDDGNATSRVVDRVFHW